MRSYFSEVIVVSIAVATLACDNSNSSPESVTRDSAGVTLVQHPANLPQNLAGWSVDTTEVVSIGTSLGDDASMFSHIVYAGISPNGELVVAEGITNDIRIFDLTGRLIRRMGGRGDGPGEFQWLRWVTIDESGSIISYDGNQRRLTRFSSDGSVAGVISLASHSELSVGNIIGYLADGSTLLQRTIGLSDDLSQVSTGLVRDTVGLYLLSPDGSDVKLIGRFPGPESIRAKGKGVKQNPAPFGLNAVIAVGDSGFYVSTQENYQYQVYDYQGHLKQVVQRSIPRPLVDEESKTRWIREADEQLDKLLAKGPLPPFLMEVNGYRTIPTYFPAHANMMLDRTGNLWIQDYLPFPDISAATTWIVFNSDGAIVAQAKLPKLQITEITEDQVVGVWHDADSVPYVRIYRLLKKAGVR